MAADNLFAQGFVVVKKGAANDLRFLLKTGNWTKVFSQADIYEDVNAAHEIVRRKNIRHGMNVCGLVHVTLQEYTPLPDMTAGEEITLDTEFEGEDDGEMDSTDQTA